MRKGLIGLLLAVTVAVPARAFIDGFFIWGFPFYFDFWYFSPPPIYIYIPNIQIPPLTSSQIEGALALQANDSPYRPDVDVSASGIPQGARVLVGCYLSEIDDLNRNTGVGAAILKLKHWNFKVIIDNTIGDLGNTEVASNQPEPRELPPGGDYDTEIVIRINKTLHTSQGGAQTVDERIADTILHEIAHHVYHQENHTPHLNEGDAAYWIQDFGLKYGTLWKAIFGKDHPIKTEARNKNRSGSNKELIFIPTCGADRVVIPPGWMPDVGPIGY